MDVQIKPISVGTLLLAVCVMPAAVQAQYLETGTPGDAASWRSPEFQRDWGLARMQADQAYAAGITGKGVKVGELDSGFDSSHPEFATDRYHAVMTRGSYVDGTPFNVAGTLNPNNDSHGTHVTGTIGASRDGSGMHGVAYNAQIYVANTNKNDSFLFGPNPVRSISTRLTTLWRMPVCGRSITVGARCRTARRPYQPGPEPRHSLEPRLHRPIGQPREEPWRRA